MPKTAWDKVEKSDDSETKQPNCWRWNQNINLQKKGELLPFVILPNQSANVGRIT